MRQTPELDKVQERMQPGALTLRGFLGSDKRKLVDILAEDAETVATLRLNHGQIADRLRQITEDGRDVMEGTVLVEGRYDVHVRDDRGRLPSPWDTRCTMPEASRSYGERCSWQVNDWSRLWRYAKS